MSESFQPSQSEFNKGCIAYEKNEQRDSMYKVATHLMQQFWGHPADMADALGVLLATWNNAFYRYGSFSYDSLQTWIEKNLTVIERFRSMEILQYDQPHNKPIAKLFDSLRAALQIASGKSAGRSSPVSSAKAFHLLAPKYFPIWDDKISKAYGCSYYVDAAANYLKFIGISKKLASDLSPYAHRVDRSILKLIDEYNYAKYTKKWI